MIKITQDRGETTISLEGHRIDLMAEIPCAFGSVMQAVYGDAPKEIRDLLIKHCFEQTLMVFHDKQEVTEDAE